MTDIFPDQLTTDIIVEQRHLIKACRARGATFTLEGDRLKVQSPRPLPDDLVSALRDAKPEVMAELRRETVPPVVWKGTVAEYRSLLVVREAELVVARAQLTSNPISDWYLNNTIIDLEKRIADIRKWLTEADQKRKEA